MSLAASRSRKTPLLCFTVSCSWQLIDSDIFAHLKKRNHRHIVIKQSIKGIIKYTSHKFVTYISLPFPFIESRGLFFPISPDCALTFCRSIFLRVPNITCRPSAFFRCHMRLTSNGSRLISSHYYFSMSHQLALS